MTISQFRISAFGDEVADDLASQLSLLSDLKIGYLELRGVWGKNVLDLTDEETESVKKMCDEKQISVSSIGSPIGKSSLADPEEDDRKKLTRIMQIAQSLGTDQIRVFSYYPPDTGTSVELDQYVEPVVERLKSLAELAASQDCVLLLENEKGIVGDTIERCAALLSGVAHPSLQFAWDPANFVQVGEEHVTERGWPLLGRYLAHVHVKDVRLADGTVAVAGEGDGQIGDLLSKMLASGYQGYLALEPHLVIAGHSSGFSGAEGMTLATQALRKLMAEVGCLEQAPSWS